MSLATCAAPFDETESFTNSSDNNYLNNKKRHNRTQKVYPKESFDTSKVNSVLEKLHNNSDNDDDDMGNFNPPPKPISAGVQKTKPKETMATMENNNEVVFRTLGKSPQPNYEGGNDLDLNDYKNYGDEKTNEEYYKNILPGYKSNVNMTNKPYYSISNYNNQEQSQDVLLKKINYMITLLEDQQDERTNNVTEEVVLYSFLGIFIIFIADTFVRAGKYVR